jgi:two-component system response regulator TctD
MAKILILEDDADLLDSLKQWLEQEHHACDLVSNGLEALEMLGYTSYDLLILDVQVPGMSGFDVLRKFRQNKGLTPVIMLTSRSEIQSKLEGLDSGADDYLTKPFDPQELSARVRAQLRRRHLEYEGKLSAGDIELDSAGFVVSKSGVPVHLKPKEFAVLEFFMHHQGEVFSSDALLQRIWPSDTDASPEGLRVHIAKIRSKIDTPGQQSYIETVHRLGYKFAAP